MWLSSENLDSMIESMVQTLRRIGDNTHSKVHVSHMDIRNCNGILELIESKIDINNSPVLLFLIFSEPRQMDIKLQYKIKNLPYTYMSHVPRECISI